MTIATAFFIAAICFAVATRLTADDSDDYKSTEETYFSDEPETRAHPLCKHRDDREGKFCPKCGSKK